MNGPGIHLSEIRCKGRPVPAGHFELFAMDDDVPDGAWALQDFESGVTHFNFVCPCGCRGFSALPLDKDRNDSNHSWAWDGNREAPTLSPSIFRAHSCGWHGFFRAGVWETV